MRDLAERVEQNLRSRKLVIKNQAILVAVSGGLDSMVLLHVLGRLAPGHGWKLIIAHFNHQLRGRSSEADERLVRKTAAVMRLRFISERADVRAFAREEKLSVEMGARKLRHQFLARTALKLGIRHVALAHHADDQLELFFLRLLRGSGSEGLSGMKWSNPSPENPSVELVRPLLEEPKSVLRRYARENQVALREDASNDSLDIQRNRIRHRLLPVLREEFQPALAKAISRTMDIVGAETEFVTEAARVWWSGDRLLAR